MRTWTRPGDVGPGGDGHLGALIVLLLALATTATPAADIQVEPPETGDFIRDYADMISPSDQQRIRDRAQALHEDENVALFVVTIESMAQYGPADVRVETYARMLLDQWQREQAEADAGWGRRILLLTSRDDQRTWIEPGGAWPRETADTTQQILDEQVVPRFRDGDFSAGIVAGVRALDAMARGDRLPQPRKSLKYYLVVGGLLLLAIFSIVSLVRHGSTGWAWLFWGAVLAALGYTLWQVLSSTRSRRLRNGDEATGSW